VGEEMEVARRTMPGIVAPCWGREMERRWAWRAESWVVAMVWYGGKWLVGDW
jgi:hypothetical protein